MKENWVYRSIMGDEPTPARPNPSLPIVDDPEPLFPREHDPRTDALIRRLETERAIKSIFDDEMLAMMKNPGSPVEPSTSFPPLPQGTADPRRMSCECGCPNCRRQDCANCMAEQKCELSTESILNQLLPVVPEEEAQMRAAALSKQRVRLAKKNKDERYRKHYRALKPMADKFKSDLVKACVDEGYSCAGFRDTHFLNLQDAMARTVVSIEQIG